MQYVRSLSGSVSKTWNSINPATLSGAIDVIVVEQDDGSLACSPFHVRFGKFSLLRPYEKKVEFRVNDVKQEHPMKLGEGGEAFFVFETDDNIPEALQTSPLVSPATSPAASPQVEPSQLGEGVGARLQEPEPFALESESITPGSSVQKEEGQFSRTPPASLPESLDRKNPRRQYSKSITDATTLRTSHSDASAMGVPSMTRTVPASDDGHSYARGSATSRAQAAGKLERTATDSDLPAAKAAITSSLDHSGPVLGLPGSRTPSPEQSRTTTSSVDTPSGSDDARARAMNLSKKLWTSNISNQVTDSGDLMLDMAGFAGNDGEQALHAEVIARQLLSQEIDGPYDIGALIGADEKGNVWVYSSEEAKEAAGKKAAQGLGSYNPTGYASTDALSDPGYHSGPEDDARSVGNESSPDFAHHARRDSDSAVSGMASNPNSPGYSAPAGERSGKTYAKTLRLSSDQLHAMDLKPGANTLSFTVNRATCTAHLWRWRHDVPIVISDIDGTITKSDVLGHILTNLGRDWTHQGVAKLYTDIATNGYNFLYLTSRSVGQADATKAYLDGVVQEGYRLPKGPVILSPDRTIAALRREIYLRKPEIFKMACLRDIMTLFSGNGGTGAAGSYESAGAGLHARIPSENSVQPGPVTASTHTGLVGSGRGRGGSPFYAGFGNRLTDALSYRSVNIPSTRIFTINSNSEVSLDLLSLNTYKTAYSSMRAIVDHYFPPVGLLVAGGGEEFTDFNYWRDTPLAMDDFTDSESEDEGDQSGLPRPGVGKLERASTFATTTTISAKESILSEDEAGDDGLNESFISADQMRASLDESIAPSYEGEDEDDEDANDDDLTSSMLQEVEADEEYGYDDEDEDSQGSDEDDETGHAGGVPVTPDGSNDEKRLAEGGVDLQRTPR